MGFFVRAFVVQTTVASLVASGFVFAASSEPALASQDVSLAFDGESGAASSSPGNFITYRDKLYYVAYDSTYGGELRVFDGRNHSLVGEVRAGSSGDFPYGLTVFNDKLYFSADNGITGFELWVYDGSSISLAADINQGAPGSDPLNFYVFGNKLFFSAITIAGGRELWSYDGTSASLVSDIRSGNGNSSPQNFFATNNKLYFSADDGTNGRELWSYDGTTASLAVNIAAGNANSDPGHFASYNGTLYFAANNGISGTELWSLSGATASLVVDINPGAASSFVTRLTVLRNKLVFLATDGGAAGYELRTFDGSVVSLAADVYPGTSTSDAHQFVVYNDVLYFTATDGVNGHELHSYDGTNHRLVANINPVTTPGFWSSMPGAGVGFQGRYYFSAEEPTYGREIWAITFGAAPYAGPLVTSVAPMSATAGQKVVISGLRLGSITSIEIDGVEVQITEALDESLSFVMPAVTSGIKNVKFSSSYGVMIHQELLRALPTTSKPQRLAVVRSQDILQVSAEGYSKVVFRVNGKRLASRQTLGTLRKSYLLSSPRTVVEIFVGGKRVLKRTFSK